MDDVCSTSQPRAVQEAKPTVKQAVACTWILSGNPAAAISGFSLFGIYGHFSFKCIKSIVMIIRIN